MQYERLVAAPLEGPCDPARDRAAILGMAGTFDVAFAFDETEALAPGYEPEEPYRADATEVVTALASDERHIVLQHVLLLRKHSGETDALKHWRQDWTFEDPELVEFHGQRVWERRTLTPDRVRCTWSQAVFEVDDGPRYEGFGRFVHSGEGESARAEWTSQATWRPLPRREYTHRHDYDVLLGTNRHVITKRGWQHEQDNVKYVLAAQKNLVREHGFNEYKRVERAEADVAQRYLQQTAAFWEDVRAEWQKQLDSSPRLLVHQELSGKPLYEWLFPMADAESDSTHAKPVPSRDERRAQIHAAIASYVQLDPPASVAALVKP